MTPDQVLAIGGFLVLLLVGERLIAIGWLLVMFFGILPSEDAGMVFLIVMLVSVYIKFRR